MPLEMTPDETPAEAVLRRWGHAVRTRRDELKLSQSQLAALAKLDQTTVSSIERGAHQLTLPTGLALAEALQTTYDALFSVGESVA
jgi:transcriptional regulator with XRE-family HTH domain